MIVEVCCGSVKDCIVAQNAEADRIELNSALSLGGLTPTLSTLINAKKQVTIPIICMVRVRPDGFCYDELELDVMLADCELLLKNGADGIAFGALNADCTINNVFCKKMVDLIHAYHKQAVFHMAIHATPDIDKAIKTCVELGFDRILCRNEFDITPYQHQLEFVIGGGITSQNLHHFSKFEQIHGSFKKYCLDPSGADYRETDLGYQCVDEFEVKKVVHLVHGWKV